MIELELCMNKEFDYRMDEMSTERSSAAKTCEVGKLLSLSRDVTATCSCVGAGVDWTDGSRLPTEVQIRLIAAASIADII